LVYLYGSRANLDLRGGDIDLLVISERLGFPEKISILTDIKAAIGEQRVDLLLRNAAAAAQDPFVQDLMATALEIAPGH
jgi:predicted nucleotidyltransferase